MGQLASEEQRVHEIAKQKKHTEAECQNLKFVHLNTNLKIIWWNYCIGDFCRKEITEHEMALRRAESEKQSKENQMRTLAEESHKQEAVLARLEREKKQREEAQSKLQSEFQSEEVWKFEKQTIFML